MKSEQQTRGQVREYSPRRTKISSQCISQGRLVNPTPAPRSLGKLRSDFLPPSLCLPPPLSQPRQRKEETKGRERSKRYKIVSSENDEGDGRFFFLYEKRNGVVRKVRVLSYYLVRAIPPPMEKAKYPTSLKPDRLQTLNEKDQPSLKGKQVDLKIASCTRKVWASSHVSRIGPTTRQKVLLAPLAPCSEDFSLSAERREEYIRARGEIGAFAAKE